MEAALPRGRFVVEPDDRDLHFMLQFIDCGPDDVADLAAEAQAAFADLFDPLWAPVPVEQRSAWHLRHLQAVHGGFPAP